jgi:hypothetical protein
MVREMEREVQRETKRERGESPRGGRDTYV